MTTFTNPSAALANRLTTDVDYEERLVGVKLHGLKGNTQMGLFSLREAMEFMGMDDLDDLQRYGSKGSIHYVDFDALVEWVREVHGDDELADAIEESVAAHDNYRDQVGPVKELMGARLAQVEE